MRELFDEKLDFKNPIIDILIAVIIGIVTFAIYDLTQEGVVFFAIPILVFLFFIYDRKCFFIVLSFILMGFISIGFYYSFGKNRVDIFTARINREYKDYYIATSKGREFYLHSDKALEVNEKVVFNGKFKKEIDIDKGYIGHLFIKKIIKEEKDFLYKIRSLSGKYYNTTKKKIGKEKAAIATALIFGDKNYLEKSEKEDLKDTGVLHLICISGFHIAFIYTILRKFLPKCIVIPVVFLYVLLTGLTASGMRAYLMLVILEFSFLVKRNYSSINGLALSAVLLLIFNPNYITNVGFYLSYFATLGILILAKKFHRLLYFLPDFLGKSISLSLAAQVFIYPIMIISFGKFSLNFILGSLILTPLIYFLLPIGLSSFMFFLIGFKISIIDKILSLGFMFFNLIIEYLKYYAIESYFSDEIFAVIYVLLLIFFYLIYKGYLEMKYYKLSYSFFVVLFLMSFTINPTISLYNQRFNNALIIERGFERIAYTSSKSEYFLEKVKKKFNVSKVEEVKKDIPIYLGKEAILFLKEDIDKSFIMLSGNNYGIIDLLNKDESIVFIKNRIYIDERGK